MITNEELADRFELLGKLMELHGENSFKAKSYLSASFNIGRMSSEIDALDDKQLAAVPGIGKAIYEKIKQLQTTGHIPLLDELMSKTPVGVLEMMGIKGLGPKKVGTIWKELGIESVGELEYACMENRLSLLKGFGEKTQQNVLKNIEFLKASKGKFLYANAERSALELEKKLRDNLPGVKVELSGQFRRRTPIMDEILILVGADDPEIVFQSLDSLNIKYENENENIVLIETLVPVTISVVPEVDFYISLFDSGSSTKFIEEIKKIKPDYGFGQFNSEEDIFSYIGIKFIVPEMREGLHEFEWSKKYSVDDLVDMKDIKGVVHSHSKWSDGNNTVKEMAEYCIKMGFEYLVMSDHSRSAVYANGLTEDRIFQQHAEIDKLNKELAPFKIYKSIESDILFDGNLDYDNDVLATFDCVITSVHSTLKMTEEKATSRLLKAIENPYTTILGHPTGRLLLSRPGYPIEHKTIIDACAANKVIIELNANPWRLDLDWQWIYYAMEKGVMISIDPDAHSLAGIHDIHYGTLAARKGGLVKQMLFNGKSREEMNEYLSKKKKWATNYTNSH